MSGSVSLERIVDDLNRKSRGPGAYAEQQTRAAFFDWVVALPLDTEVPRAARAALRVVNRIDNPAPTLVLFRDCLQAATESPRRPTRRHRRVAANTRRRQEPVGFGDS